MQTGCRLLAEISRAGASNTWFSQLMDSGTAPCRSQFADDGDRQRRRPPDAIISEILWYSTE